MRGMGLAALAACAWTACFAAPAQAKIEKAPWGQTADGQKVDIYTLTNARGMSARITNYGAFLVSLTVPDKNGKMADVVAVRGNVLKDIAVTEQPVFVMKHGAVIVQK